MAALKACYEHTNLISQQLCGAQAYASRRTSGFEGWITAMEVTNTYRGGYWEDRGFNWFSGI